MNVIEFKSSLPFFENTFTSSESNEIKEGNKEFVLTVDFTGITIYTSFCFGSLIAYPSLKTKGSKVLSGRSLAKNQEIDK